MQERDAHLLVSAILTIFFAYMLWMHQGRAIPCHAMSPRFTIVRGWVARGSLSKSDLGWLGGESARVLRPCCLTPISLFLSLPPLALYGAPPSLVANHGRFLVRRSVAISGPSVSLVRKGSRGLR